MKQPEKREWQRVSVNMMGRARVIDGPARYDAVRIVDMHHQGCCLEGVVAYEHEQAIRIILEIPFEGEVSILGNVAWVGLINDQGEYRSGIRFVVDDPRSEEVCMKLYHFCMMRKPKT